ncbi:hypothetical protein [Bacillus cereus group sp. MYBKT111-2]|uniref:hypothetical protein n=1 Tax=Bacillus cereus group sp. MYBKT111-2 TaxID=3450598 RepID=UPI00370EC1D8
MDWWQSFLKDYQWVFAVVATFTAASLAQVVAHYFTRKREKNAYLIECYQNFYSPILFKVLLFFDVKTAFSKKDMKENINENQIFEEIIDLFAKNLKYATPSLIASYEMVKKRDIYDDVSGQRDPMLEIKLCFEFMEELESVSRKLGIKTKQIEFLKYRVLFALWLLLSETYSCEVALTIMKNDFEFNDKKLNKRTLKKVKKLLSKDFKNHTEKLLVVAEKIVINIVEVDPRGTEYNPLVLQIVQSNFRERGAKSNRLEKQLG